MRVGVHAKNSAWYTLHNSSSPSMVHAFSKTRFVCPVRSTLTFFGFSGFFLTNRCGRTMRAWARRIRSELRLFDGRGPRYSTATRLQLVGSLPSDAPPQARHKWWTSTHCNLMPFTVTMYPSTSNTWPQSETDAKMTRTPTRLGAAIWNEENWCQRATCSHMYGHVCVCNKELWERVCVRHNCTQTHTWWVQIGLCVWAGDPRTFHFFGLHIDKAKYSDCHSTHDNKFFHHVKFESVTPVTSSTTARQWM